VVPRAPVAPAGCVQVPLADAGAVRDIGAVLPLAPPGAAVQRVLATLEQLAGG